MRELGGSAGLSCCCRLTGFAISIWRIIAGPILRGKDPELAGAPPLVTRWDWARHVSGLPYWGWPRCGCWPIWRSAGQWRGYLPASARRRIAVEAQGMALGYALWSSAVSPRGCCSGLWILPVLLGQPVLRLYLLAEHGDCPQVTNMFENTRTTFTTALMRFLAWNMPYHVEHHVIRLCRFTACRRCMR